MKRLSALLLAIAALALSSCATVAPPELALDLRNATVPVMLNAAPSGVVLPVATFSSGKNKASLTTTSNYGGVSTSSTISLDSNINTPIGNQLLPILLVNPQAVYLENINLAESYLFAIMYTKESTLLSVDARIKR
jgi:hypothetical protein